MKYLFAACLAVSALASAEYITIGDTDNVGYYGAGSMGEVDYEYNIGKHEVSVAEYEDSDLLDESYSSEQSKWGSAGPIVDVTVYDAMRYCNWLTSETYDSGAYIFNADGSVTIDRETAVSTTSAGSYVYVLPTYDEWLKAAYYDVSAVEDGTAKENLIPATGWSAYAHGGSSDVDGVNNGSGAWDVTEGSDESNGTVNMDGNVSEWLEDTDGAILVSDFSGISSASTPLITVDALTTVGFRVVQLEGTAVPEPATASLCLLAGLIGFIVRRFQCI